MTSPISSIEPELFWDSLLSRQAEQIRAAYQSLLPDERAAILDHLQRMATEDGWHPEQRLSAQIALDSLRD